MSFENLDIQFVLFDPEKEDQMEIQSKARFLHALAPSESTMKLVIEKVGATYKGVCRISSVIGVFMAEAIAYDPKSTFDQVEKNINGQLSSWKARRFSNREEACSQPKGGKMEQTALYQTYGLRLKNIEMSEDIQKQLDSITESIINIAGNNIDLQFTLELQDLRKKDFSTSLVVTGLSEPIVVQKVGKKLSSILNKLRRVSIRKIKNLNKQIINNRKKHQIRHLELEWR